MTKDEALKLALEASEVLEALFNQAKGMHEDVTAGVNVHCQITVADLSKGLYAAAAIREALAQPEQEPLAWLHTQGNFTEVCIRELDDDEIKRGWTQKPLYTTPPHRKPLTDEEIVVLYQTSFSTYQAGVGFDTKIVQRFDLRKFARSLEAKHGIKE